MSPGPSARLRMDAMSRGIPCGSGCHAARQGLLGWVDREADEADGLLGVVHAALGWVSDGLQVRTCGRPHCGLQTAAYQRARLAAAQVAAAAR